VQIKQKQYACIAFCVSLLVSTERITWRAREVMGWEFCFIQRMVKKEDKLICKTVTACDGYVWQSGWKKHLIPYFDMRMLQ
jgi:hypothetical protein